ncbi:hypothetical protein BASA83_006268 [Batrachochytrium salamandrivorans]|nr:hypothetical protein BASA83_006268 [Batrachochytrium salamandrivorans]
MNNAERNYDIYDKEAVSSGRIIQALETLTSRWSPSSYCLVRSQESGIFYVDQETDSSTGSLVTGTIRIYFTITHRPGKLNGKADSLSRREDYFLDGDQSNFQRIIDPDNVLDLQVAMADPRSSCAGS